MVPTERPTPDSSDLARNKLGADSRRRRDPATPDPRGSRSSSRPAPHRIPFDFDESTYQRLERLREDTECATKAEVVRRALGLYEWLANKAREGNSLVLENRQNREGPIDLRVIIPLSQHRPRE